jgi:hypothetical protein
VWIRFFQRTTGPRGSRRSGRPGGEPDPFKPHGFFLEEERAASGQVASSATILLTNKECPWRCLMCDLWKNTTTQTVPPGAIARQIDYALSQLRSRPEQIEALQQRQFFDPAAIPPADYPAIARTVTFAKHVVVESHPRLVGEKALRFRDLLSGSLEVAMGLETVHPQVLPRLNKKFELAHFSQAAGFLRDNQIAVRAFVLVKPPFLDEAEGLGMGCEIGGVRVVLRRDGGFPHPHASRQRRAGTPDGSRRILAAAAFHFGKGAGTRPGSTRRRQNFCRYLGLGTILELPRLFRKAPATDSRHEFVTTNPACD